VTKLFYNMKVVGSFVDSTLGNHLLPFRDFELASLHTLYKCVRIRILGFMRQYYNRCHGSALEGDVIRKYISQLLFIYCYTLLNFNCYVLLFYTLH
jgi:hypothetical protein